MNRYLRTAGLIGSVGSAIETAEQLREAGVDELACLLDFGVPTDSVMDSLDHLNLDRQKVCS